MNNLRSNSFSHLQKSWWMSLAIFLIFSFACFSILNLVFPVSFQIYPLYFFISAFVANSAVVLIQNYRKWHFFGTIINKYTPTHFVYGLFLPLLLFLPILFVLMFFDIRLTNIQALDVFFYIYYIGFAATAEELFFRGVLFQMLIDKKGEIFAIFLSSIIFALGHLLNPNVNLIALINVFLAGIVLGFFYIRTAMLWLSIGFHFGWNFWQKLVLDSPISGLQWGSSLLKTKITELNEYIFGGSFGVEGGIVSTLLLVVSVFIVAKRFVPCPEVISRILREKYSDKELGHQETTSSKY